MDVSLHYNEALVTRYANLFPGYLFLGYLENEVDANSSSVTRRDKPTDSLSEALALKNKTITTQL